jgi:hypothetical protein
MTTGAKPAQRQKNSSAEPHFKSVQSQVAFLEKPDRTMPTEPVQQPQAALSECISRPLNSQSAGPAVSRGQHQD